MQNPEAKKPNRTLLYVIGGCVVVFFLCAICSVALLALAGPQVQQVFNQVQNGVGGQAASEPTLPAPTGAANAPTRVAPTTAASQPSSGGNSNDALLKAFTSWGSVKSFRAKIAVSGSPAGAQAMTMEMVLPDRIHMTSAQFEMILIGNTSYVKIGPTWQKMNLPQSIDTKQFDPKTYATQFQGGSLPDIKILGPDTVDGVPTIAYQFGVTGKGSGQDTLTKVWIGVADGFPHKIETGTATITFSDFNANIAITAPIP